MRTETQTKTETDVELEFDTDLVAEDDLDDVIEIALRMMQEEEGALTEEEVKEVAAELDIPAEYIERARAQLQKTKLKQEQELRQKKQQKMYIGVGAGVLVLIVLVTVGSAYSSASGLHNAIASQEAQIKNVMDRQKETEKLWASKPDTPDKMAELQGAQNRVRVEIKRYNELVQQYNDKVSGPIGGFATMFSSLPGEASPK